MPALRLTSQLAHREPLTLSEAAHALVIDTQAAVDWAACDAALPEPDAQTGGHAGPATE